VSNDPLTRVDPLGTYETEVHYYLTYFLALTAGLPQQQAMVIATAAEYIDHNPVTTPFASINARERYHFTQKPNDDTTQDITTRFILSEKPADWNSQLQLLHLAAMSSRNTACAKAQLYGEFLHAFEDTFSHRDENNVPFWAGGGHVFPELSTDPDKTYNIENLFRADYRFNELRTLEMENEVFAGFQRDFGRSANNVLTDFPIEWSDLAGNELVSGNGVLQRFNREQDDKAKVEILQQALEQFGLPRMQSWENTLESVADQLRTRNLQTINRNDPIYAGVILPAP
jgi:hypothetical protein